MTFKFEKLEVWKLSLKYIDTIYRLADDLPSSERYNQISQIRPAATSVSLNIAEGSTGQSDAEQYRYVFRKALNPKVKNIREESENYLVDGEL